MNLYVYLIAALLVAAMVGAAGYKGYALGQDSIRVEWQKQALEEANANAAKYRELSEAARAKEAAAAKRVSSISKGFQKDLADANDAKDNAVAALRSGALQLRDPGATGQQACGSASGETAGAGRGIDGRASGQLLSEDAAVFLVSIASEADRCAAQVKGLQDIIRADRQ